MSKSEKISSSLGHSEWTEDQGDPGWHHRPWRHPNLTFTVHASNASSGVFISFLPYRHLIKFLYKAKKIYKLILYVIGIKYEHKKRCMRSGCWTITEFERGCKQRGGLRDRQVFSTFNIGCHQARQYVSISFWIFLLGSNRNACMNQTVCVSLMCRNG